MTLTDYLAHEWRPALGCTEPACIAYAAASAAALCQGDVLEVQMRCDPRMYKNCFAVGIPHSDHKTGLRWALALGALADDPSAKLEIFRQVSTDKIERAQRLIDQGAIQADVDPGKRTLYVDCLVKRTGGQGRAVISGDHTGLVRLERDGEPQQIETASERAGSSSQTRRKLASLSFEQLVSLAQSADDAARSCLQQGTAMNMAIAQHGLSLLPERFLATGDTSVNARSGKLVCAGVYARMCGEDFPVMSLAGSGNKGITCAVPLSVYANSLCVDARRADEALALACLITSATTYHLGTLSAVCGCSNAAGIGLAAGLVYLEGGTAQQIGAAVTNMVGNIAGMICDGAKIGCAMKTMTAVDSAFRAASFALSGVCIPVTDGIVGASGQASLLNLGRVANEGMTTMDSEILDILRDKM